MTMARSIFIYLLLGIFLLTPVRYDNVVIDGDELSDSSSDDEDEQGIENEKRLYILDIYVVSFQQRKNIPQLRRQNPLRPQRKNPRRYIKKST